MKQNLSELVDAVQPEMILLDRMNKNPRTTWNKKRQQLIASLSQRAQTIDEPSADDAPEPMQTIRNKYQQPALDSANNVSDYFKYSDRKVGLKKLTPINEERILNSLAAPNRRKSLDPRAMNKTISHSSGHNLLSERLKEKQIRIGARQTSLADVN